MKDEGTSSSYKLISTWVCIPCVFSEARISRVLKGREEGKGLCVCLKYTHTHTHEATYGSSLNLPQSISIKVNWETLPSTAS